MRNYDFDIRLNLNHKWSLLESKGKILSFFFFFVPFNTRIRVFFWIIKKLNLNVSKISLTWTSIRRIFHFNSIGP